MEADCSCWQKQICTKCFVKAELAAATFIAVTQSTAVLSCYKGLHPKVLNKGCKLCLRLLLDDGTRSRPLRMLNELAPQKGQQPLKTVGVTIQENAPLSI